MKKNSKKKDSDYFKIFKKEVEFWLEKFGLKDWCVFISHEPIGIDSEDGACSYEKTSRVATISLNKYTPGYELTPNLVKLIAFHEVCELLLAPLITLCYLRTFSETELEGEKHAIIRRLENAFFKEGYLPVFANITEGNIHEVR